MGPIIVVQCLKEAPAFYTKDFSTKINILQIKMCKKTD